MEDLGVTRKPRWDWRNFDLVVDSLHNAELGCELIESILRKRGMLDFGEGVRKWGRLVRRDKGVRILDRLVFNAFGRKGWIIPNQYWTPGVLAPMAIMGKYFMHYGNEFLPPRELGRKCAERLCAELILDDAGFCRFHRGWAEEMMPDVFEALYGMKEGFLRATQVAASRINSRNLSVYWESERNLEYISTFLKRKRDVEQDTSPELAQWIAAFEADKHEAGLNFWFEALKGISETLRDFN